MLNLHHERLFQVVQGLLRGGEVDVLAHLRKGGELALHKLKVRYICYMFMSDHVLTHTQI